MALSGGATSPPGDTWPRLSHNCHSAEDCYWRGVEARDAADIPQPRGPARRVRPDVSLGQGACCTQHRAPPPPRPRHRLSLGSAPPGTAAAPGHPRTQAGAAAQPRTGGPWPLRAASRLRQAFPNGPHASSRDWGTQCQHSSACSCRSPSSPSSPSSRRQAQPSPCPRVSSGSRLHGRSPRRAPASRAVPPGVSGSAPATLMPGAGRMSPRGTEAGLTVHTAVGSRRPSRGSPVPSAG